MSDSIQFLKKKKKEDDLYSIHSQDHSQSPSRVSSRASVDRFAVNTLHKPSSKPVDKSVDKPVDKPSSNKYKQLAKDLAKERTELKNRLFDLQTTFDEKEAMFEIEMKKMQTYYRQELETLNKTRKALEEELTTMNEANNQLSFQMNNYKQNVERKLLEYSKLDDAFHREREHWSKTWEEKEGKLKQTIQHLEETLSKTRENYSNDRKEFQTITKSYMEEHQKALAIARKDKEEEVQKILQDKNIFISTLKSKFDQTEKEALEQLKRKQDELHSTKLELEKHKYQLDRTIKEQKQNLDKCVENVKKEYDLKLIQVSQTYEKKLEEHEEQAKKKLHDMIYDSENKSKISLDSLNKKFQSALASIDELKKENERLQSLLDNENKKSKETLRNTILDWEQKLSKEVEKYKSMLEAQKNQFVKEKTTFEAAAQSVVDNLQKQKEQIETARKLAEEKAEKQNNQLRLSLDSHVRERAELLSSIEIVEKEKEVVSRQKQILESSFKHADEMFRKEIQQLRQTNELHVQELSTLSSTIESLKKDKQTILQICEKAEQRNASLKQVNEKIQKEFEQALQTNELLSKELSELTSSVESLRKELQSLSQSSQNAEQLIVKLQLENESTKAEKETLQNSLNDITNLLQKEKEERVTSLKKSERLFEEYQIKIRKDMEESAAYISLVTSREKEARQALIDTSSKLEQREKELNEQQKTLSQIREQHSKMESKFEMWNKEKETFLETKKRMEKEIAELKLRNIKIAGESEDVVAGLRAQLSQARDNLKKMQEGTQQLNMQFVSNLTKQKEYAERELVNREQTIVLLERNLKKTKDEAAEQNRVLERLNKTLSEDAESMSKKLSTFKEEFATMEQRVEQMKNLVQEMKEDNNKVNEKVKLKDFEKETLEKMLKLEIDARQAEINHSYKVAREATERCKLVEQCNVEMKYKIQTMETEINERNYAITCLKRDFTKLEEQIAMIRVEHQTALKKQKEETKTKCDELSNTINEAKADKLKVMQEWQEKVKTMEILNQKLIRTAKALNEEKMQLENKVKEMAKAIEEKEYFHNREMTAKNDEIVKLNNVKKE
jgi:hypothetical protein